MNDRAFKAYLIACFTYLVGASTYLVLQERERVEEARRKEETQQLLYEEACRKFEESWQGHSVYLNPGPIEPYNPPETKRKWWKR